MHRRRAWLAAALLAVSGCADPTGAALPALLQFTLTPLEAAHGTVEAAVVGRSVGRMVVEGTIHFTGCSYLVPEVHGWPYDVRLYLTLAPTGGFCTPNPLSYLFVAEIGGIEQGPVRVRVQVRPAGDVLLDLLVH